jgi:hypothetical protein
MSEEYLSTEEMREFVPGTTAGPFSPGATAYPAGAPAPIFFGATQPTFPSYTVTPGGGFTGAPVTVGVGQQIPGTPQQIPGVTQQIPGVTQQIPGAAPQVTPGLGLQTPTAESYLYTQGYLQTQIGKSVRIEFLIGESLLTDRRGILVQVGIDYVVIQESESDDYLTCDLYSIKFVTTYL